MMIKCNKCRGRMFLDVVFSEYSHYELFCIRCGKRPMISKESGFGRWLTSRVATEV
jgi:ribosomal protein S27E